MKYIYTQKELPQRSEEWLNFRRSGIGASEISKLLGYLPPAWGTAFDIYAIKMGKAEKEPTEDMIRGILNEDKARNMVVSHLKHKRNNKNFILSNQINDLFDKKLEFSPSFKQLTVRHKKYPHIFASLDGIDIKNKLILEIKCPKQSNFEKIINKPKINRGYIAQVQTQLEVANSHWGITEGIFVNFFDEGVYIEKDVPKNEMQLKRMVITHVTQDCDMRDLIIKTCNNFWEMVETGVWNREWNLD